MHKIPDFKIFVSVLFLAVFLAGCSSSSKPEGKPLPQLTFDYVHPVMVNVAQVNVDNRYKPGDDLRDVSESFPTPPDMAMVEYVSQRFRPNVSSGRSALNVIIEDMHVYQKEQKPDGALDRWLGLNDMEHYDVFLAARLVLVDDYGHKGSQVRLEFHGDLDIPEHYSVAKREKAKMRFLEAFMKNVDDSFVKALRDKLHVAVTTSGTKLYGSAPVQYTNGVVDDKGVYVPNGDDADDALNAPQSLAPPEMR